MIRVASLASLIGTSAVGVWTVLASRLFVWMGGLSQAFPSPWTTWWRYAHHPNISDVTLVFLVISGIAAALPILLVGAAIWRLTQRGPDPALYGETDWADREALRGSGINTGKRPF